MKRYESLRHQVSAKLVVKDPQTQNDVQAECMLRDLHLSSQS